MEQLYQVHFFSFINLLFRVSKFYHHEARNESHFYFGGWI